MKIETIYNELREIQKEAQLLSLQELLLKMEKTIREDNCYKVTSKTRVNAIKRVASKLEHRPALKGYGVFGDYKVVTDSYHLIAIKQEEMPIPLVATKEDLDTLGIDLNEYRDKYGIESVINAHYPDCRNFIDFSVFNNEDYREIEFDFNSALSHYKMNKSEKSARENLFRIKENEKGGYDIRFIKNIIDTIGTNSKVYYKTNNAPLYFVNENNEIGLVLPIMVY